MKIEAKNTARRIDDDNKHTKKGFSLDIPFFSSSFQRALSTRKKRDRIGTAPSRRIVCRKNSNHSSLSLLRPFFVCCSFYERIWTKVNCGSIVDAVPSCVHFCVDLNENDYVAYGSVLRRKDWAESIKKKLMIMLLLIMIVNAFIQPIKRYNFFLHGLHFFLFSLQFFFLSLVMTLRTTLCIAVYERRLPVHLISYA